MDVTGYLRAYGKGVEEMTPRIIIHDIHAQTGITATAGIGSTCIWPRLPWTLWPSISSRRTASAFLRLDEMSYRKLLWGHRPITDFWRVGRGYAKKLELRAC